MSSRMDPYGLIGATLRGRYSVDWFVGVGRYSVVYRGTQLDTLCPVALKFLKVRRDLDPSARATLLQRMGEQTNVLRDVAQHCPCFCETQEVGSLVTVDGRWLPFLAQGWLDGTPLEMLLAGERARRDAPRTLSQAMELVAPIADALAYAHARGLVHGSVAPRNVFVRDDAREEWCAVEVLDLGVAQMIAEAQAKEHAFTDARAQIYGFCTAYGAPEQFERGYGEIGAHTDVFALALMIVELVTGRAALGEGDDDQLQEAATRDDVRPTPRNRGLDLGDFVETVFERALALRPEDRYASMAGFWEALRAANRMSLLRSVTESPSRIEVSPPTSLLPPPPTRPTPRMFAAAPHAPHALHAPHAHDFGPTARASRASQPPPSPDASYGPPPSPHAAYALTPPDGTYGPPPSPRTSYPPPSPDASYAPEPPRISYPPAYAPEHATFARSAPPPAATHDALDDEPIELFPRRRVRWSAFGRQLAIAAAVAFGLGSGWAFVRASNLLDDEMEEVPSRRAPVASTSTYSAAPAAAATAEAPMPPAASSAQAAPSAASAKPAAAHAEESCPTGMVKVPGGRFFMGSDDDLPAEKPAHHVTLSPYCMDAFEVTTAQYLTCAESARCRTPTKANEWAGITSRDRATFDPLCNARDPAGRAQHPINCVDWWSAKAYCESRGARLPTEAEWEFAARGSDGRKYPWGDAPPSPKLLNACGRECLAWARKHGVEQDALYKEDDGWATTAPVGSFPAGASLFGVNDMVGNVWEWTADFYGDYTEDAQVDPHGPATGAERAMRGGAWNGAYEAWVRGTFRYHNAPDARSYGIGFRCAKSL